MSRLPSMPVLGPCGERGGILLGRVRGAKVNLLQWRSTTTNVLVELPVYLDDRDALRQVEQVLVHIHGREREGGTAWTEMGAARSRLPVGQQAKFLIVAPQFLNGLDKPKYQTSQQTKSNALLVWKGNGWSDGSPSVSSRGSGGQDAGGVSSFEAIDAILRYFANESMYPALKRIVLSGHSMGGQLVHRYSILGSATLPLHRVDKVQVEYVVMNPASYLYFSVERPGQPAVGMNEYKYGFERLSSKLSCYPGLEDRYDPRYFFCRMMRQRTVRFLNGNADRGVGDDRPEAMAQGADRIERAIHYQHHLEQMQARFGLAAVQNCTLHWIPNVKHDGRTMATSDIAIAHIFRTSLA